MFKRLKTAWKLSKKDAKAVSNLLEIVKGDKAELEKIIDKLPDSPDGNAEYLGEGSLDEYEQFKKEQAGMDKWYRRLKELV